MADRSLTIYIDGRSLLRPRDGVGTYVRTLLQNMLALDKRSTFIALGFSDQRHSERLLPEGANFRYHFLPMPRKAYMGLFRLWQAPVDAFLPQKPDVVWYPDFVAAPWIRGGKKILTIHDLTFIHDAETVEAKNLRYLQRFVPQSITRSHAITTVSHAVAADIAKTYHPATTPVVIYPAAPSETPGSPDTANPYILFVGTLQPRKNIKGLLKAYRALPALLQKKYRLVLAGRKGWNEDTETTQLLGSTPHEWVNGPSDAELNQLYQHASLFVLPSLREGFGTPPVEALAHHVPVITSTDAALTEATGEAALHVPAHNPQALADAMKRLLTNKAARDALAAHRAAQLARLNGAKNAGAFLQLIGRQV